MRLKHFATALLITCALRSTGQGFILEVGPPLAQDGIGIGATAEGFVAGVRMHARDPQRQLCGFWRFTSAGAPIGVDTLHALGGKAFAQSMAMAPDGSCFLVGSAIPDGGHDHAAFMVKRAASGAIAWITQLGIAGSHQFLGAHALSDGGALACGVIEQGSGHDALVARISPSGSVLWSAIAGETLDEEAHAIALVGDAVIVTGRQMNFGGTSDAWFARFSLDGESIWTTSWGEVGNETGYGLAALGTSAFVMAGTTNSFGPFDQSEQRKKARAYLLALDLNGDSLWTRSFGDTLHDQRAFSISPASNGDLLISGERSTIIGSSDAFAARVSPSGALLWQRTWDLGQEERLLAISALPDGLVTTGWVFGDFSRQLVLIRRDANGN
jgi:hypothetical protein